MQCLRREEIYLHLPSPSYYLSLLCFLQILFQLCNPGCSFWRYSEFLWETRLPLAWFLLSVWDGSRSSWWQNLRLVLERRESLQHEDTKVFLLQFYSSWSIAWNVGACYQDEAFMSEFLRTETWHYLAIRLKACGAKPFPQRGIIKIVLGENIITHLMSHPHNGMGSYSWKIVV